MKREKWNRRGKNWNCSKTSSDDGKRGYKRDFSRPCGVVSKVRGLVGVRGLIVMPWRTECNPAKKLPEINVSRGERPLAAKNQPEITRAPHQKMSELPFGM